MPGTTWGGAISLKRKQDEYAAVPPPKRPRIGEVRANGGMGSDGQRSGAGSFTNGNGPGVSAPRGFGGGAWSMAGAPPTSFPVATRPGAGAPYNYNMPGSSSLPNGANPALGGSATAQSPDMNNSGGDPTWDVQSEETITLRIHPMPHRGGSRIHQQYTLQFLQFPSAGRRVTGAINRDTPIMVTPQGMVEKIRARRNPGAPSVPISTEGLQTLVEEFVSREFNFGGVNLTQSTGAVTLAVGGPCLTYYFWPDANPLECIGLALLFVRVGQDYQPDYGINGGGLVPGNFGATTAGGGVPYNAVYVGAPDVLADQHFNNDTYDLADPVGAAYRKTFKWVMAAVTETQFYQYVRNNNKKIPTAYYNVGIMLEHPPAAKVASGPEGPVVFQPGQMSWPEQNHSVLCKILRQSRE
jgi:hypothetical protein